MFRILCICAALLLTPLTAQAERIERAGPVRLVCMNPEGLYAHVEKLTRNQIIGVRYAALDGEIKWPCDDVQLPVGITVLHERWLQTEDRWWVLAQTIEYPNGAVWVTVDPMQATYHQKPIQWRCYYPNYCTPIIPDDHHRRDYYDRDERYESYPQSRRDRTRDMDVDEGQKHIQRQLEALRNRQ